MKNKHIVCYSLGLLLISAHIIAGSSGQEYSGVDRNQPVAKVGDRIITVDEFYNSYEFGPAFVKRVPDSKRKYLNYMINEKLIALEGYSAGVDKSEQAMEMQDAILNDLATEELFKDDILEKIKVSQPEIDTVVNMKKLQVEINWLYSVDAEVINDYWKSLSEGSSFDSLVQTQLSDSVLSDMRSMKTNRYQLGNKNPQLAGIVDTLAIGSYSFPIHTDDGWYIVSLRNAWRNVISTESETQKLISEAKEAVLKQKMDKASDKYVNKLLLSVNPVIKRNVFQILRSYLAQFTLSEEQYSEWSLTQYLNEALAHYDNPSSEQINNLELVVMDDGSVSLEESLKWYRSRIQNIKFNKTNLNSYSSSVEQAVWRMVRDKLLARVARERGYTAMENVVEQSQWWNDKISFSEMLNQLKNSIDLKKDEIAAADKEASSDSEAEQLERELSVKLFREIQKLKNKYSVEIYDDVLNKIQVSSENDPGAIDMYTVKKGGLIPRTPYPSIDMIWKLWE